MTSKSGTIPYYMAKQTTQKGTFSFTLNGDKPRRQFFGYTDR